MATRTRKNPVAPVAAEQDNRPSNAEMVARQEAFNARIDDLGRSYAEGRISKLLMAQRFQTECAANVFTIADADAVVQRWAQAAAAAGRTIKDKSLGPIVSELKAFAHPNAIAQAENVAGLIAAIKKDRKQSASLNRENTGRDEYKQLYAINNKLAAATENVAELVTAEWIKQTVAKDKPVAPAVTAESLLADAKKAVLEQAAKVVAPDKRTPAQVAAWNAFVKEFGLQP